MFTQENGGFKKGLQIRENVAARHMVPRYLLLSVFMLVSLASTVCGKCILDLPLNDGGADVVDRSANQIDAVFLGYPEYFKWLSAQPGSALEFTGKGKYGNEGLVYIVDEDSSKLAVQNPTVAFWVNPYLTTNVDQESILRGPDGSGWDFGYRITMTNIAGVKDVMLAINFGDVGARSFSFGFLPANKFTHLAFTYDHQKIVLYKNGEVIASEPETRDINYDTVVGPGFVLGFANQLNFTGILAGVKIFDEALPANAIKEILIKEPAPVIKTGPEPSAKPKDTSYYSTDKLNGPRYDLCRNLVQNPSFEAGFHYWKGWGQLAFEKKFDLDSRNAFSGGKSLHLYGYKGKRESGLIGTFAIPVTPGQKYTVSFYARGDTNQSLAVSVKSFTGSYPGSVEIALTAEWKRHSFTFTAPNCTATIFFSLSMYPKQDGQGWLDAVQMEPGEQTTDYAEKPIAAELVTNQTDNLFQPGEKIDSRLEIHTRQNEKGFAAVSIKDFFGQEILNRKYPFAADNQGFASLAIALPENLPSGLYVARADFTLADGYQDYDFFRFGIMKYLNNTHKHKNIFATLPPTMMPDAEGAFQRLKRIGVGSYVWMACVPDPRVTEIADRNNVSVVTSVFYWAEITYDEGDGGFYTLDMGLDPLKSQKLRDPFVPEQIDLKKLAENVYRVVKAHPEITFWKTINEPDHDIKDKPEKEKAFVEMLRVTAKSVRAANPNARILSFDPTNMYPGNGTKEIESAIDAGLLDACDIIAIHPYRARPENPDFDSDTDFFLKMLDKHGFHGEVWFTEGIYFDPYNIPEFGLDATTKTEFWRCNGLSYDSGLGERMAAAYNARMWLVALKYGKRVKMLADWEGFDYILDVNGIPRAYEWATNTLGNILGNADYVQDIDVSDDIRSYLFEDQSNRPVAVFWNINDDVGREITQPASISLAFKSGEVTYLNFMGQQFNPQTGQDIPISAYPIFVRGKSKSLNYFRQVLSAIQTKGGEFTAVKPTVRIAGPEEAVVNLFNRTSKPVNSRITIELADNPPVTRDVEIGSKETASLPVALPAGPENIRDIPLKISLLAAGKSKPQSIDASFRLLTCRKRETPVTIDGDLSDWPDKYRIVLPDTFNEFPPDINLGKSIPWKGRQDLSADLYSAWDQDYLYLALKVRDDILFLPPENTRPGSFFRYDSLQLYFDTSCDARDHLPMTGYDGNDYNYDVACVKDGLSVFAPVVPEWQLVFFNSGPAPEVKTAFKKTTAGMVYELAFPANRIRPIVLKDDTSFGFALLINDNDNDYRKRGLTLTPAGTEPYLRPDLYPIMLLK